MTLHDKARELVELLLAYDARTATGRLTHRAADLITAQAEEIHRLREALVDCTIMLLELREESEREISYGEEDPFRMGEWFDAEMLMRIHNARAALSSGEDG